MTILVALKKKQVFIYAAIGLTAGGYVVDIIIFGVCGRAISNMKAAELMVKQNANGLLGVNQANNNFDQYYAVYSLLILCGYIHFILGIVVLVVLSIAVKRPQERDNFEKEFLTAESPTFTYPKMLQKPAMITAVCQISLGVLIFIFGSVVATWQGQWPKPPGFTAGEGIWGGPIIIAAGALTIFAAKLKTKLLFLADVVLTALTILIDILLFGICGYVIDELNRPTVDSFYNNVYPRPNLSLWTAIYDILLILAFIHIVVAIVAIVIHILVFVPNKYLPKVKKAPMQSQARIVSQYQANNQAAAGADRYPASDLPRRLDIVDSRDVHVREAPPVYSEAPPRYDDLPPSPDPYNTAAGYNLSFAPVRNEQPQYQDQKPRAYNERASGGHDDQRKPVEVGRRPLQDIDHESYPRRGAQPYSEHEYSPEATQTGRPLTHTPHTPDRDRHAGGASPRYPSGREYDARHPSDSGYQPDYERNTHRPDGGYGDYSPRGHGDQAQQPGYRPQSNRDRHNEPDRGNAYGRPIDSRAGDEYGQVERGRHGGNRPQYGDHLSRQYGPNDQGYDQRGSRQTYGEQDQAYYDGRYEQSSGIGI